MEEILSLIEVNGALYQGGALYVEWGAEDIEFTVDQIANDRFDITVLSNWSGEGESGTDFSHASYFVENGRWVFDKVDESSERIIVYTTWYSGDEDPYHSCQLDFKPNGIVTRVGYRNEDTGTYVVRDSNTIVATFNDNYWDYPGSGFQKVPWIYTETYSYDAKRGTLFAVTSGDPGDSGQIDAEWYGDIRFYFDF